MADVKRLPGDGCRHHTCGHCLYEENLNPGYESRWKCRVLLHWEAAFDDFLARAECFGVAQDAVPDLWGRQFERMARKTFDCEQYVYCPECDIPACIHALDGLCRASLPLCEGRCRHFQVNEPDED